MSRKSSICKTRLGSADALVLDNGSLRLTALPELGGRIVSIVRLESGYEYLLQPRDPEEAYRPRCYGNRFEDYESNGFDECAPTVGECLYPEEPFLASQLPDHGDIWCLPSEVEIGEEEIRLTTHLRSLPLRFTKKVQLQGDRVRLDYEATNLSRASVKFLWSAHPLLRVETGAKIILPEEVKEVEVAWSKDERLGRSGDRCPWPITTESTGGIRELNKLGFPSAGIADKLFTARLSQGFCAMLLPGKDESIAFHFDPQDVPYVGIWVCQGGWPTSRAAKHFTVALEPCSGRPDSLDEAVGRKECAVLAGYRTMRWWMEIELIGGPPR